jgi:hypothetical protein
VLSQSLQGSMVTDGFVRFGPPQWEFSGEGFRATGGFDDFFISWGGVPVGQPAVFRAGAGGSNVRSGSGLSSATVGGVDYPLIYWTRSAFLAETVPVTIPPGQVRELVTLRAPFTFTANLCGATAPSEFAPCELEMALIGSGITTIHGFYYKTDGPLRLAVVMAESGMRFTAIPEPAAGALIVAGIVSMLAVCGRVRGIGKGSLQRP